MKIEAAERKALEDLLRQDESIGDDDRDLGAMSLRDVRRTPVCNVVGVSTVSPNRRASRSTGLGVSYLPRRPAGFGARV